MFILLGLFFVGIGVLGAVVPGLPSTPFLLLASYFLARSWPRLNQALLRSHLIGPILEDWQVRRGVRPHVKVKAILVVAVMVALTLHFTNLSLPLVGLVAIGALVGIWVILRLPGIRHP